MQNFTTSIYAHKIKQELYSQIGFIKHITFYFHNVHGLLAFLFFDDHTFKCIYSSSITIKYSNSTSMCPHSEPVLSAIFFNLHQVQVKVINSEIKLLVETNTPTITTYDKILMTMDKIENQIPDMLINFCKPAVIWSFIIIFMVMMGSVRITWGILLMFTVGVTLCGRLNSSWILYSLDWISYYLPTIVMWTLWNRVYISFLIVNSITGKWTVLWLLCALAALLLEPEHMIL